MLAALPLPAMFSEWPRPLAPDQLAAINAGYSTAFTFSAVLIFAAFIFLLLMKPLEIQTPGEDAGVATA
jgi:hypothetical protein